MSIDTVLIGLGIMVVIVFIVAGIMSVGIRWLGQLDEYLYRRSRKRKESPEE